LSFLSKTLHSIRKFPGKLRVVHALAKGVARRSGPTACCSPLRGVTLQVNLLDRIQREMWGGCYEPHIAACIAALLGHGDTFLDVGAHIGFHATLAASFVGPTGKVHAFEADPGLFAALSHNLKQFPWAEAHHNAVWHSSRELTFERSFSSQESGWGTLTAVRDLGKGEHLEVQAVSLDDWSKDIGLGKVSLIKIDAEGSELSVLRGARSLVLTTRPGIIFEMNEILLRYAEASPGELIELVTGYGYSAWAVSQRRLRVFQLEKHAEFSDVLCLPVEGKDQQLLKLMRAGFKFQSDA